MEMKQKLEEQKRGLDFKDSQLFFEKSKNLRLRIRERSLREQLTEYMYARRGSLTEVCHDLEKASEKGLLKDKRKLNGLLESVAHNFHVTKNGRRYSCSPKLFMEVLLLWRGPGIATFAASNLCGPEINSTYRWRNQHRVSLADGIVQSNFKILGTIYKDAMSNIQVKNVPVLAAEDETAAISQVSFYSEATDELLGFCGVDGADHKCLDKFTVVVGNGEQGYNAIVNTFSDCKICSFARAIILNPLHPNLPRLTVLTMPTCKKLNTEFVFHQWQEIERLSEQELEDIIRPLIGRSSDGDS